MAQKSKASATCWSISCSQRRCRRYSYSQDRQLWRINMRYIFLLHKTLVWFDFFSTFWTFGFQKKILQFHMPSCFTEHLNFCYFFICMCVQVGGFMAAPQLGDTRIPKQMADPAQDGRWLSQVTFVHPGFYFKIQQPAVLDYLYLCLQHSRFITETHDQEPEVVFIGDSLIQRLQDADVSCCHGVFYCLWGRSIDWLIDWLIDWWFDWLMVRLIDWFNCWRYRIYRLLVNGTLSQSCFFLF